MNTTPGHTLSFATRHVFHGHNGNNWITAS